MALGGEIECHRAAVQYAQDNNLAMQAGRRRDAEHHILAAHRDADTAILRQPSLRDIELRENLDPRDDRRRQPRRLGFGILQIAIIAVADT